jgi:dCMP deaminase
MNRTLKWDIRFLELAKLISTWSKDPSTQVGAVITDGIKVISIGYNGLPMSVRDDVNILNNREEKYKYIIHAEMNAILAAKCNLHNFTLYTYPFLPCTNCASMTIQAGIKRVVSIVCQNDRWKERLEQSKDIFNRANIDVVELGVYI